MSFDIKITSRTWNKESYSLYDYESNEHYRQSFLFNNPGNMMRIGQELQFVPMHYEINDLKLDRKKTDFIQNTKIIFDIFEENGSFFIRGTDPSEPLCRVISRRYLEGNDNFTYLKEGDEFRLGRLNLKILKIGSEQSPPSHYQQFMQTTLQKARPPSSSPSDLTAHHSLSSQQNLNIEESEASSKSGYQILCRFCLSEINDLTNPLISLCKCSGSLKYVHVDCVRMWIKSKIELNPLSAALCLLWEQLCCEICKTEFPLTIRSKEKSFSLVDFEGEGGFRPNAVLELKGKEGENLGIYFLDLKRKEEITLGRANDCDIKLNDISVSRLHAKLKMENDKIILKDENSKFGTIILERNPLEIIENKRVFQLGRSVIEINLKRKWYSRFMCFGYDRAQMERNTIKIGN